MAARVRECGVTMVQAVAGLESGFRKANDQVRAMLADGPAVIERSDRPGVRITVAPGATVRTGEIVGGNLIR